MDLSNAPKRQRTESIVPMINVVFLLLIFFLMTSRLAQPDPFEITPPVAELEGELDAELVLYVDKDGQLGFEDLLGDAVLNRLADLSAEVPGLQVRADAGLEAAKAAKLLRDLAAAGFGKVELVVSPL